MPLHNKQALQKLGANRYFLSAHERKVNLSMSQKNARLYVLEKILEQDFNIYKKYKETVNLSEKVSNEAIRDFNNGRLGLETLTDFNNSLVNDQKTLSGHRIQLIVRVVEFLDYFQYFDHYL